MAERRLTIDAQELPLGDLVSARRDRSLLWLVACRVPRELVAAADRGVVVIPVMSAGWDDDPVPGQRQRFPRLPAPRRVE
jgi:hypothetical protein